MNLVFFELIIQIMRGYIRYTSGPAMNKFEMTHLIKGAKLASQ